MTATCISSRKLGFSMTEILLMNNVRTPPRYALLTSCFTSKKV